MICLLYIDCIASDCRFQFLDYSPLVFETSWMYTCTYHYILPLNGLLPIGWGYSDYRTIQCPSVPSVFSWSTNSFCALCGRCPLYVLCDPHHFFFRLWYCWLFPPFASGRDPVSVLVFFVGLPDSSSDFFVLVWV